MKYLVETWLNAHYTVEVDADNKDDAIHKAEVQFYSTDFSKMNLQSLSPAWNNAKVYSKNNFLYLRKHEGMINAIYTEKDKYICRIYSLDEIKKNCTHLQTPLIDYESSKTVELMHIDLTSCYKVNKGVAPAFVWALFNDSSEVDEEINKVKE